MTNAAYGTALDPIARGSIQYVRSGPTWDTMPERTRVLRDISRALMQLIDRDGKLILFGRTIGDVGGHVLAAALTSMPSLAIVDTTLTGCGLGPASASAISIAMRRGFSGGGLRTLILDNNPDLGDSGIAVLASVLPCCREYRGQSDRNHYVK